MTCRLARLIFRFGFAVFLLAGSAFAGNIIHVPANYPTIQEGINHAVNGDTVSGCSGHIYNEDIDFSGKAITVASSGGSALTIINGTASGPVVNFVSGETSASVREGFTIQNGSSDTYPLVYGGGVLITRNQAADGGYGTAVLAGSPQILNNHITDNFQHPAVDLGLGGGILVNGEREICLSKHNCCLISAISSFSTALNSIGVKTSGVIFRAVD